MKIKDILTQILLLLFLLTATAYADTNDQIDQEFMEEFDDEFENEFSDDTTQDNDYDPFKNYNKAVTHLNHNTMLNIFIPLSKAYEKVTTKTIRLGVNNFFKNLLFPVRVTNNLLQMKFQNSIEETQRFAINSTIGVGGFIDVAKGYFNIDEHKEDFGQTLGYYGVSSGPHIVIPFYGPSNLRDLFSMYPDNILDPFVYTNNTNYNLTNNLRQSIPIKLYDKLNIASLHYKEYLALTEDSLDLYTLLKSAYEQNRNKMIKE
ncbi:MAG: VacJ family lipoprotein [Campylobacterota bacterium]|nr:VacJ family lipoprotein [Campylobacterota bacterium]